MCPDLLNTSCLKQGRNFATIVVGALNANIEVDSAPCHTIFQKNLYAYVEVRSGESTGIEQVNKKVSVKLATVQGAITHIAQGAVARKSFGKETV